MARDVFHDLVREGLDKTSYALVHQICAVDGNCFKDAQGDWFRENASPELLKKVFDFLPEGDRETAVNDLLDDF